MGISHQLHDDGIAEVVMDNPPVNALTVAGWFELADMLTALGRDPTVRVVVLRAEGRGLQRRRRHQGDAGDRGLRRPHRRQPRLLRRLRRRVRLRRCRSIAAVNGFCLGGGIGLVGNADVIVAADDATFGLPEVDRGALGAATHLSRLVPQHKMRAMVYTSATATAQELHHFGSVLAGRAARPSCATRPWPWPRRSRPSRPPSSGPPRSRSTASTSWDVKRSYRFEQGFTFELNLSGVADEHRDAFVAKRDTDTTK